MVAHKPLSGKLGQKEALVATSPCKHLAALLILVSVGCESELVPVNAEGAGRGVYDEPVHHQASKAAGSSGGSATARPQHTDVRAG